jgi:hypothetical protein
MNEGRIGRHSWVFRVPSSTTRKDLTRWDSQTGAVVGNTFVGRRLKRSTNGSAAHLRGSRTHHLLLGRLSLDVDSSLEIGAIINGDALGSDVARDNS